MIAARKRPNESMNLMKATPSPPLWMPSVWLTLEDDGDGG